MKARETMDNLIKYIGKVKISFKFPHKTKSKLFHNNGTENLFLFLSRALTGESISEDIPNRIDLRKEVDGSYTSVLLSYSYITGLKYVKDGNDWCVRMTGTILKSQISGDIDETAGYRLYLISKSNHDLAYIECSAQDLLRIESGAQAIIEWTLKFVNEGGS